VSRMSYSSFFSELRKLAAKIPRETSINWSRKGKRPIRVEKLLEKEKDGGFGWKTAESGTKTLRTGWIPSKEDKPGNDKLTERPLEVDRITRTALTGRS
jgi:hypothetical protein